jgi:hypothetical protein
VRGEVIEIGSLKTLRIPYYFFYFKSDAFPEETVKYPVMYWRYENSDAFREDITVKLPEGQDFTEVPKDVRLTYQKARYELTFEHKSPGILVVHRVIQTDRSVVAPQDYAAFRSYVEQILDAEAKLVAFK